MRFLPGLSKLDAARRISGEREPVPRPDSPQLLEHLAALRNALTAVQDALDALAADETLDGRQRGLAWGHGHWVDALLCRVSFEIGAARASHPFAVLTGDRRTRPGGNPGWSQVHEALAAAVSRLAAMSADARLTASERAVAQARTAELEDVLVCCQAAVGALSSRAVS